MNITPKITPVAQQVLFVIGHKNYYLVGFKFNSDDYRNDSFTPREVQDCLKEKGYTPANFRPGDEIVTHPKIKDHDGPIGLLGTFSEDQTETHRVVYLNKGEFRFYDQNTGTPGLPHPVLCYK